MSNGESPMSNEGMGRIAHDPRCWSLQDGGKCTCLPDFDALAKAEGDRYDAFQAGSKLWSCLCAHFLESGLFTLDLDDFTQLGLDLGLLTEIPYDPEVHVNILHVDADDEIEPGDLIYVETPKARLLRDYFKKGVHP